MRGLGCPERTIQAVLVAEVQHWFDQAWAVQPAETNYWMNGSAQAAARRRTRALRRQFVLEERTFLEGLFGVPWYNLPAYVFSLEREAWGNEMLDFLPDDRFDAASGLFIKFLDLWREIEDREPRLMTAAEIDDVRGEINGIANEFAGLMSPAEIEEMELRIRTIDVLDVWGVEEQFGSELSGREFREILRIQRGQGSTFETLFMKELLDDAGLPAMPKDPAQTLQQETQLRALLGNARYQGYLRAQDFDYRFLSRSVRGLGAPSETVWAVYDIRRAARETADRVRSDSSFDEADQQARLEAIRDETRLALRGALGASAYAGYSRDGVDWVDALVTQPPEPP